MGYSYLIVILLVIIIVFISNVISSIRDALLDIYIPNRMFRRLNKEDFRNEANYKFMSLGIKFEFVSWQIITLFFLLCFFIEYEIYYILISVTLSIVIQLLSIVHLRIQLYMHLK